MVPSDATPPTFTGSGPVTDAGTDASPSSSSSPVQPSERSPIDRIVRQLLLIGDASPRALFDLKGSMLIAGVRCTLTYIIIPFGAPLIGWLGVLAAPFSLALSVTALLLAISSLRRVWMADYRHRWPYTAFIVVAVTLLSIVIIGDTRTLLA